MLILFEVSEHIGALSTVGLVVLTAAIGIQILKQQGFSTFSRANRRLDSGELPGQEILEGLFLAVGGAFLLTPGFVTDTLGFLCLIGPTRRHMVQWLIKSGKLAVFSSQVGGSGFTYTRFSSSSTQRPPKEGIYEGEFTEENPATDKIEVKSQRSYKPNDK